VPSPSSPAESRRHVEWLLRVDPQGGVVAEEDGELAGVGWVHRRGPVATVGPLAVEPRAQGRGVGRRVLDGCIEAAGAGVTQVRLVHESQHVPSLGLFLRAGFRVVAPLVELELPAGTVVAASPTVAGVVVRGAQAEDRAAIVVRDARAFGAERPRSIDVALEHGRAVIAERGRTLAGHALEVRLGGAASGRTAFAGTASADDPDVLLGLLATLTAELSGGAGGDRAVRIIVPAGDRRLVVGLLDVGFRVRCAAQYMVRGAGTPPPPNYVLMNRDLM
jgi:GNAT superfamily N-acetyltransferase